MAVPKYGLTEAQHARAAVTIGVADAGFGDAAARLRIAALVDRARRIRGAPAAVTARYGFVNWKLGPKSPAVVAIVSGKISVVAVVLP